MKLNRIHPPMSTYLAEYKLWMRTDGHEGVKKPHRDLIPHMWQGDAHLQAIKSLRVWAEWK